MLRSVLPEESHLLDAALVDTLLAVELHLQWLAHVQAGILDLQQRIVHQVLPPPDLQGGNDRCMGESR